MSKAPRSEPHQPFTTARGRSKSAQTSSSRPEHAVRIQLPDLLASRPTCGEGFHCKFGRGAFFARVITRPYQTILEATPPARSCSEYPVSASASAGGRRIQFAQQSEERVEVINRLTKRRMGRTGNFSRPQLAFWRRLEKPSVFQVSHGSKEEISSRRRSRYAYADSRSKYMQ